MPLKKTVTDRAVKEFYNVMATEHFARLSNVAVRLLNDWQRTKTPPGADANLLQARIRHLEQKAERLQTKLEALEAILSRQRESVPAEEEPDSGSREGGGPA